MRKSENRRVDIRIMVEMLMGVGVVGGNVRGARGRLSSKDEQV